MKYFLSILFFLSSVNISSAGVFNEVGDAGELVSTAQNTAGDGSLDAINGYLDFDDVDLFKISVTDFLNFEVSMTASLTPDASPFPVEDVAGLWLFDMAGDLVTEDSSYDLFFSDPALFDPLASNGMYLLAVALFGIEPDNLFDLDTGWYKDVASIQEGSYTLQITGAEFSVPVPAPPVLWLLSIGLIALVRNRKIA
ncbi:hypothetical protein [Methyloprofundus sp.]|uniref:hypothetical protein n=1 Tax=Methyloprofundus sp. TaxID=2020875 RepID=UPI003D1426CB